MPPQAPSVAHNRRALYRRDYGCFLSRLWEAINKNKSRNLMRLRVWYGLRKLTKKAVKKPAIVIVYENSWYWKNEDRINQAMKVIYTRYQTEQEASDAPNSRYTYIYYELFLENRLFKKSPELAIQYNSYSDRKQVSEEERELIASKIRADIYKFYNIQEPDSIPINSWQLIINH